MEKYFTKIAAQLNISPRQIQDTVELLEEGGTVPFIARYRKEKTDNLDEVEITGIRDLLQQLKDLDKRRKTILDSIQEQGKLTDALKAKILECETLSVLEDIYLPFKPKRRTRATIAKEKGLEPLAKMIFEQKEIELEEEAKKFMNIKKEVKTIAEALAGARDIMAEWMNEDAQVRAEIRALYQDKGTIQSKVLKSKMEQAQKFKDYFEWQEPVSKAPSHRILAMRRGEKEGFLSFRILVPEDRAHDILFKRFVKNNTTSSQEVITAAEDCFKRLLSMSIETEMRMELKKRADAEAIEVFVQNLRQLLMASPMGAKNVLAIDPGLRTGCKMVALDSQGKLLADDVLYLCTSESKKEDAADLLVAYIKKFAIEVIAIGNGTAGRETEAWIRSLGLSKNVAIVMVNESGASIYSASEAAREEFPNYDLTVRGAVSIGRRLMDPLAELVKIDPKSIGVGQYQHDVDQSLLKNSLDDVVMSCVNQVGVEVNTASKQLLSYVSGLGPAKAQAMVEYRNAHGAFKSRKEFKKVAGFGAKVFEQAAGFIRILDAKNPLDGSAVHPEAYPVVEAMAKDLKVSLENLIGEERLQSKIDLKKYVTDSIGVLTLQDVVAELGKPGRDPREEFQLFTFADVHSMEELTPGMKLPGVVTNVTAFGAFVDVGVHQDGLIHISQLSDRYVENPHDVVSVNQKVTVTVLEVDLPRKRIALSAKQTA